jgi:hypothetical protein
MKEFQYMSVMTTQQYEKTRFTVDNIGSTYQLLFISPKGDFKFITGFKDNFSAS